MGMPIMEKFAALVAEEGEVTSPAQINGRQIIMVISPKNTKYKYKLVFEDSENANKNIQHIAQKLIKETGHGIICRTESIELTEEQLAARDYLLTNEKYFDETRVVLTEAENAPGLMD